MKVPIVPTASMTPPTMSPSSINSRFSNQGQTSSEMPLTGRLTLESLSKLSSFSISSNESPSTTRVPSKESDLTRLSSPDSLFVERDNMLVLSDRVLKISI